MYKILDPNANPSKPSNLKVETINSKSIRVSWLPSLNSNNLQNYEVIAKDSMGNVFRALVPKTSHSHTFDNIAPESYYAIEVRALSSNGKKSEALEQLFSLAGSSFHHHQQPVKIHAPKTSEDGHDIIVKFTVEGRQGAVRAYQIEQKDSNNNWNPIGSYIPVDKAILHYSTKINRSGLASGSQIRIVAIGSEGRSISHSHAAQLKLACEGTKT